MGSTSRAAENDNDKAGPEPGDQGDTASRVPKRLRELLKSPWSIAVTSGITVTVVGGLVAAIVNSHVTGGSSQPTISASSPAVTATPPPGLGAPLGPGATAQSDSSLRTGHLLAPDTKVGWQTGPAPPFTWTVHVNEESCSGATTYHVVAPSLEHLVGPYRAGPQAVFQHAPDGLYTEITVTFQGKTNVATVLEAVHVHVAARARPAGTAYQNGELQCGGLVPAYFSVNLDEANPQAVAKPGSFASEQPAVPFPFEISSTDPQVFYFYGGTWDYDCQWFLEVDWSSEGNTGTIAITDNGHSFQTEGFKGLQVFDVSQNFTSWVRATTRPHSPVS